jgi:hypothetical protein
MRVKVGDVVRSTGASRGLEGTVTRIMPGESPDWHGMIEIRVSRIIDPSRWPWVRVGDMEHFSHYEWWSDLSVVHSP